MAFQLRIQEPGWSWIYDSIRISESKVVYFYELEAAFKGFFVLQNFVNFSLNSESGLTFLSFASISWFWNCTNIFALGGIDPYRLLCSSACSAVR